MMACLLEVGEPPAVCGDIIQFLCFAHIIIINFRLFSLVHHAWVFTQIFVKGHIGQLFNVPFDANVSESDKHLKDNLKLVLT